MGVSGASGSGVASSWLVTGKLEVGRAGIGICAITGGGIVECDRLLVSTGSGALGLVGVSGLQSETTRSTLNATAALIGAESSATLTVEKGALARFSGGPFFLGFTAPGQIDVSGFDAATGKDSELRVSSSDFPFSIGTGANGLGELTISGGASATVECPRMEIGESNFGIGLVTVEGEGGGLASTLFVTGTLEIGGEGAGQGVLTLNRGTVDVIGDVNVLSNGILQGIGTLTVSGQITSDGIISPGLSPGTLTIKGNFVQGANGIVRAEIAGQAAGAEHDQLVITGNASFGGKLVLQFMNGFAPHAGDKFDVIAASGTTNSNFSEVQVTGLQAGAQFDANTSGGVLTATALNDGVALPTVSLAVSGKKKKAAEKGRKPAVFLISRTGDDTAPLTVSYEVSGTAENGVDYLFLDGIAVIPARKTAVAVKVKPFDDQSAEGPETIALKIVPGADYTHSLESSAAVTLLDNERKEPLN